MVFIFETPTNIDFDGYAYDNTPYIYYSNKENVLDTKTQLSTRSTRKNVLLVFNK